MRFKAFMTGIIIFFIAEIIILICLINADNGSRQDAVEVNEAVQSVVEDWDRIGNHQNSTSLDYTVLDRDGNLIFATRQGLSESINAAVINRDTILDVDADGGLLGKIIIYNDTPQTFLTGKRETAFVIVFAFIIQCACLLIYLIYLNKKIIRPFTKLEDFAERVAGGNLDIPLEMDRGNIFGAFTESFDIMRVELKKARLAEARANAEKKELVVKLSHDIRTPVASIKAASEVGQAIAENEKERQNYTQIIHKADQINTLVTNLFSAALEELSELTVEPADMKSKELRGMLESADYFHFAKIPDIPDCMIYADKIRLQQVFDNIFSNSYKYANTNIDVKIKILEDENCLAVKIEDYGGGVKEEELALLKEKFKRGENSQNVDGAGLGLYISDSFMREMHGGLALKNGKNGLEATIFISLSGAYISA